MNAPDAIRSANRLSALIFADRMSADERQSAVQESAPSEGSSIAPGGAGYGARKEPVANKGTPANAGGVLWFQSERPWPGIAIAEFLC